MRAVPHVLDTHHTFLCVNCPVLLIHPEIPWNETFVSPWPSRNITRVISPAAPCAQEIPAWNWYVRFGCDIWAQHLVWMKDGERCVTDNRPKVIPPILTFFSVLFRVNPDVPAVVRRGAVASAAPRLKPTLAMDDRPGESLRSRRPLSRAPRRRKLVCPILPC